MINQLKSLVREVGIWLGNRSALRRGMIRLWLDDVRPAPLGWYWARTANEAMAVLAIYSGRVWECSLDHDLGGEKTGYDVVLWLARKREEDGVDYWPLCGPNVHSANPVGAERMRGLIDRYFPSRED